MVPPPRWETAEKLREEDARCTPAALASCQPGRRDGASAEPQPRSPAAQAPAGGLRQRAEEVEHSQQPICAAWAMVWGLFATGYAQLCLNSGHAVLQRHILEGVRETAWMDYLDPWLQNHVVLRQEGDALPFKDHKLLAT